jgi:WD40 repeat protein
MQGKGGKGRWAVYVWNAADGQQITVLDELTDHVIGVQFSEDGQQLWTASVDGMVRLWNLDSRKVVRTITADVRCLPRIAYSPDGGRVATGYFAPSWNPVNNRELLFNGIIGLDSDGTTRTADVEKLRNAVIAGHSAVISEAAFSPDGRRLASVSIDGSVKIWDVSSCKLICECEGHVETVSDVTFSPDGKRLATAGVDRTVRIWDAQSGRGMLKLEGVGGHTGNVTGVEITRLVGHLAPVTSVAFSPTGDRIVT